MVVSSVSPERWLTTRRPAGSARQLDRVERLGQRADLVELDEHGVRGVLVDAALDALRVRDEQVVADELHAVAEALRQQLPASPVVLGEAILDGDDRVARRPVGPEVDQRSRSRVRPSFASR